MTAEYELTQVVKDTYCSISTNNLASGDREGSHWALQYCGVAQFLS